MFVKFVFVEDMEVVELKEVCTFLNGRAYKQSELLDTGKYPVLRVGNFFSDKEYYYSNLELEDNKYCDKGDLLFAWSASFGPKIWNGEKVIFHYHIWRIDLDNTRVFKKYFYYYLLFMSEKIKHESHGGIMLHTTKQEMEERRIVLPNLEIQRNVSIKLDKINEILVKKKEQLSLLDNLIKSRFVEMFGDPITNSKNLKTTQFVNVVKLQRGFDLPVQNRDVSGNVPVYGSNGVLDFHSEAKVYGGGIITGRSGSIGKVFYTESDYWPLNTSLFSVELNNNNIIYLAYLLELFDLSRFADGTGVPTLNRNNVHNKQIIDVDIELQNQFADFVKQINKSKFIVQQSIDELQTLYDSLMQEYFG